MNFSDFVWLFSSRFQSLWLLWWHKWHLFWLSSVSRWQNVIRWHDVISSLFSDPFGSTYRSKRDDTAVGKVTHSLLCTQLEPAISHDNIPPAQVLEWISLLHEAWSLTTSTASSLDCQKRAVCEIWRWTWIWMSSFGMYYFIHSMDWLTVKMYTNSCDVCSKIVGSNLVSLFLRYLLLLPWTRPENKMYHTDKMDLVFKV